MIAPTPDNIKAARLAANLSQREAAALVHREPPRGASRWSEWETGRHEMPRAEWELFLLKTFKRTN